MAGRTKKPFTRRNKYAALRQEGDTEHNPTLQRGSLEHGETNEWATLYAARRGSLDLKRVSVDVTSGPNGQPDDGGYKCMGLGTSTCHTDSLPSSSVTCTDSDHVAGEQIDDDGEYDETDMAVNRESKKRRKSGQSESGRVKHSRSLGPLENNNIPFMQPHHSQHKQLHQLKSKSAQRPVKANKRPVISDEEMSFTIFDLIIYLFSIGSYLFDVGSDVFVSYLYYTRGHYWWFSLTLSFVIIPALCMSCFSLKWYIMDHQHEKEWKGKKASKLQWISRFMFLTLQIAPVLR